MTNNRPRPEQPEAVRSEEDLEALREKNAPEDGANAAALASVRDKTSGDEEDLIEAEQDADDLEEEEQEAAEDAETSAL